MEIQPSPLGLSIIVPVHGRAPFFSKLMNSLQGQEIPSPYEYVFAIDSAEQEIIDMIVGSDLKNVRLVQVPESGIANAHNAALYEARYDLTAVVHADDVILPGRFQLQMRLLREKPNVVCVGGQIELIDDQGNFLGRSHFSTHHRMTRLRMRSESPVAHPAAMYRTDLARAVRGYDNQLVPAEDFGLWVKLSRFGDIENVSEPIIQYRIHENQVSQKSLHRQFENKIQVIIAFRHNLAIEEIGDISHYKNLHKRLINCETYLRKIAQYKIKGQSVRRIVYVLRSLLIHPIEIGLRIFFSVIGHQKWRSR